MTVDIAEVVRLFGLGELVSAPEPVAGGLSNELWRATTTEGTFAVKRMLTNASATGFVSNIEAAYAIEARCVAAGVPMPEPIPYAGRALARVSGDVVRVHTWTDGTTPRSCDGAVELLAQIHAAGAPRLAGRSPGWKAVGWPEDVVALARVVDTGPDQRVEVDSHRDLNRKNTLRRADGVLVALDWDAAGPTSAVQDAVAVALDWTDDIDGFRTAIALYEHASGIEIPAEPWVFAGWVGAQGGWLDHVAATGNATETADTLARLSAVARDLPLLVGAVAEEGDAGVEGLGFG